jgi:hypothetical protein
LRIGNVPLVSEILSLFIIVHAGRSLLGSCLAPTKSRYINRSVGVLLKASYIQEAM